MAVLMLPLLPLKGELLVSLAWPPHLTLRLSLYTSNYDQLVAGATGLVPEADIKSADSLPDLRKLAEAAPHSVKPLLAKTAMLKLNGGLGTSMGLEKAKSLLVVKDASSFIDLIAQQVKHMRVSLLA